MALTPVRIATPNSFFRDIGFLRVDDEDIPKNPPSLRRFDVLVKSNKLDIGLIRSWMNICLRDHCTTCGAARNSSRETLELRVIDCETRKFIPAPEACQYVALSYVWGLDKDATQRYMSSSVFPKTIEDTIVLTQKLGYRYLWVDRYCISEDKNKKHTQIQQMNLIYSNAELTIIAAAGSDPSYGLPGVSRPRKLWTPSADDPNFPDVLTMISRTKWWTRAWTYQEAILSKRKLVITDYQAYFECSHKQYYEAVDSPPCYVDPLLRYGTCTCCNSILFVLADVYPSSLGAWRLIVEYTNRHLSHQEDILDGISGIFREFQERHEPFYFHWGIPISGRIAASGTIHLPSRFATSLCWCHGEQQDRRPGFPSWSWTGWFGAVAGWIAPIDCQGHLPVMVHTVPEAPITFKVQNSEGRSQDIVEYLVSARASNTVSAESAVLHINASILSLSLHTLSPQQFWARCSVSADHYMCVPLNLTARYISNTAFDNTKFDGIILGSIAKEIVRNLLPTAVMVTKAIGGGVSERIGFIVISYPLPVWHNTRGPLPKPKLVDFVDRVSLSFRNLQVSGGMETMSESETPDGFLHDLKGLEKEQRNIKVG